MLASIPMPAILASDDASAEAGSWGPSTRRSYAAGWRDFTQWCLDTGVWGLPAAPADACRYLEYPVEARGRALATALSHLAAVSPPPTAGEGHASNPAGPQRQGPEERDRAAGREAGPDGRTGC